MKIKDLCAHDQEEVRQVFALKEKVLKDIADIKLCIKEEDYFTLEENEKAVIESTITELHKGHFEGQSIVVFVWKKKNWGSPLFTRVFDIIDNVMRKLKKANKPYSCVKMLYLKDNLFCTFYNAGDELYKECCDVLYMDEEGAEIKESHFYLTYDNEGEGFEWD